MGERNEKREVKYEETKEKGLRGKESVRDGEREREGQREREGGTR